MRERLIEVLEKNACRNSDCGKLCLNCPKVALFEGDAEIIADLLLADGWIRPPCKVGQILFVIEAGLIFEAKVRECNYCSNSTSGIHWHIIFKELFAVSEAHIGKTVFLTRKEAEAALKGGTE